MVQLRTFQWIEGGGGGKIMLVRRSLIMRTFEMFLF